MRITKKTFAIMCALGMCVSTMPNNVQAEEEIIEQMEDVTQEVTEEEISEEAECGEATEEAGEEPAPEETENNLIAPKEEFHYEIEENEHAEIIVNLSKLGPNEYEVKVKPDEGYESCGIEVLNEAGEDVKFPISTNVLALFFLTENVTIRATVHQKDVKTYVDENGTRYNVPDYTDMSKVSDTDGVELTDGWYVVSRQEVFENRININGDVNIVLLDGAKLTAKNGIHNGESSNGHLTIWASSLGNNAGEIEISHTQSECAQIGGNENENGGTLNIHGGKINAKGTGSKGAAGIGGGGYGNGGHINIYGGEITVSGSSDAFFGAGAGIGGGNDRDGGVINIYGGIIDTCGGDGIVSGASSGIGGGDEGNGGEINIYGGTVNSRGVSSIRGNSAAIGGGDDASSGIIKIYGGTIHAESKGQSESGVGAGIGSGDNGDEAYIEIHGGRIYAKSHFIKGFFDDWQGAGIGSGNDGGKATIIIDGGNVEAEGWEAIGAGNGAKGDEVYITLADRMHVEKAEYNDRISAVRKGYCLITATDE